MIEPNNESRAEAFFSTCLLIRRVEEEIERLYPTDKIKSPVHLSIGQESVAVGACKALRPEDKVFCTYRGHAAYLAKGGDLKSMWAELYGKEDGCARGKAGSMHLIDQDVGFMGTSAIVASTIPNSVGYAWALKQQKSDAVVVNFFGDGATDEGVFHESMNFAALMDVPMIFICENNGYAIYSRIEARAKQVKMFERAQSYGITAKRIEDGDVFAVHDAVSEAAANIRDGKSGPVFLEVMTYRWRDHVGPGGDLHLNYRDEAELAVWRDKDQLPMLADMVPAKQRAEIEARVEADIAAAIDHAEQSNFPDDSELWEHVFHD